MEFYTHNDYKLLEAHSDSRDVYDDNDFLFIPENSCSYIKDKDIDINNNYLLLWNNRVYHFIIRNVELTHGIIILNYVQKIPLTIPINLIRNIIRKQKIEKLEKIINNDN